MRTASTGRESYAQYLNRKETAMRATNSDRNICIEYINLAYSHGCLDDQEVDERISKVLGCKTLGELEAVTADLPERKALEVPVKRSMVRHAVKPVTKTGRVTRAVMLGLPGSASLITAAIIANSCWCNAHGWLLVADLILVIAAIVSVVVALLWIVGEADH